MVSLALVKLELDFGKTLHNRTFHFMRDLEINSLGVGVGVGVGEGAEMNQTF